ncbi:unnamed protein product [Chrysodeixis includens]|uniref:Lipase n=1 Tax=Chrysodeixis includens TaxID=689277 RepID=A0A9P0FUR2_CHRIL|nr:unnamed protein product [Chrysodeixis includens]
MNTFFKLLILISASEVLGQASSIDYSEDAKLSFTGLANKYGQKTEEYDIRSQGEYILKLFRIPGDPKRPILFIHGAVDSADSFVMRGNTSLAIALARDNYDMWFTNYRGSRYSRSHARLNPDVDRAYWKFSVHEIGYYDIAASIDFVLTTTGEKRLSVIGYSEGTTTMYVLGSTRPEYNDKVKIFISLSPICYLHNTKPFMSVVLAMGPVVNTLLQAIGTEEVFGLNTTTSAIINELCSPKNNGYNTCLVNGLFLLTGSNPKEIEPEFFPVILGHFPAGTSRMNLNHLLQISHKRKFANYDHGPIRNMAVYNSLVPPEYDLSKVTMKIAMFVAKNDNISTLKDVALLRKRLPNVVDYKVMIDEEFNHVDYVWGRNTHKTMFPMLFKILSKYN